MYLTNFIRELRKRKTMSKYNQDTFKEELFTLLETYHNFNSLNLTNWERLRVHHILNELFEAVKKSKARNNANIKN